MLFRDNTRIILRKDRIERKIEVPSVPSRGFRVASAADDGRLIMARDFLDLLSSRVVLFDGAMGTMLYERGVFINRSFDEVNLSAPAMIESIHREYIAAGADCIETNTFGANRFKLKLHGLDGRLVEINETAARIARRAAGDDVLVAGAIGPLGVKIEPWGPTANEEAAAAFAEQARALIAGDVDCFVLETFGDVNEIHQALLGVRSVSALPVVAQMTLRGDGLGPLRSRTGRFRPQAVRMGRGRRRRELLRRPEDHARRDRENGRRRRSPSLGAAERRRAAERRGEKHVSRFSRISRGIRPAFRAGRRPRRRRMLRNNPRSHTGDSGRAENDTVRRERSERRRNGRIPPAGSAPASVRDDDRSSPISSPNGSFVSIVECVPPLGCDASAAIASARMLAGAGIDAINIPDSPRSSSRMSPLALAVLVKNAVGIDVLLHYCCRDRNILGMQSDLLGAHALGLRNILIITGDPIRTVDYPDATAVFDVDSIGLTNIVSRLNRGKDIGDRNLAEPTSFLVGVGVNPGAVHFEEEMKRFEWKVKAGADFAVTQPVFDIDILRRFLDRDRAARDTGRRRNLAARELPQRRVHQ